MQFSKCVFLTAFLYAFFETSLIFCKRVFNLFLNNKKFSTRNLKNFLKNLVEICFFLCFEYFYFFIPNDNSVPLW